MWHEKHRGWHILLKIITNYQYFFKKILSHFKKVIINLLPIWGAIYLHVFHLCMLFFWQLRIAEMEANKAKNLIEHRDEIMSRPPKTYIKPSKQKPDNSKYRILVWSRWTCIMANWEDVLAKQTAPFFPMPSTFSITPANWLMARNSLFKKFFI